MKICYGCCTSDKDLTQLFQPILHIYILTVLDRALMIGGKKNCKTPESLKRCPHSVCLSVRLLVNGLQDTPFDLSTYAIFSMNKSSIVTHK